MYIHNFKCYNYIKYIVCTNRTRVIYVHVSRTFSIDKTSRHGISKV